MSMTRKSLNAAVVASLLLFVATIGLWARSYYVGEQIYRTCLAPDGSPRVVTVSFAAENGRFIYQRFTTGGAFTNWSAAQAQERVQGWSRRSTINPVGESREW